MTFFGYILAACSGGDSAGPRDPDAPLWTPIETTTPTPAASCYEFDRELVQIPNREVYLDEDVKYDRVVVPGPNRGAWMVSYDRDGSEDDSWVLFDGRGVIASEVKPQHAGTLGRLEECVRQTGSSESREYVVPSTPDTSDRSINIGGQRIPLPVGSIACVCVTDAPSDFRKIVRGYSFVSLDSAGLETIHVLEKDAKEFRPLVDALSTLGAADFTDVVGQLDALPRPPAPSPLEIPVSYLFLSGRPLALPGSSSIVSVIQDRECSRAPPCFDDPLVVVRGDSELMFEFSTNRIAFNGVEPADFVEFKPLIDALEQAAKTES
jgi:hypothetical protein